MTVDESKNTEAKWQSIFNILESKRLFIILLDTYKSKFH